MRVRGPGESKNFGPQERVSAQDGMKRRVATCICSNLSEKLLA